MAWEVDVYGDQGTLSVDAARLTWWSRSGQELHRTPLEPENAYAASIGRFVQTLAAGETPAASTLHTHLETMAVIESAYLSARTGEPESPVRLFEMQGLAVES